MIIFKKLQKKSSLSAREATLKLSYSLGNKGEGGRVSASIYDLLSCLPASIFKVCTSIVHDGSLWIDGNHAIP
jgi:hypothetical protein